MKVLRLADARVLLWAQDREGEPFEVSRMVTAALQPLCPTAPRCPREVEEAGPFGRPPAWIDPHEEPIGPCAYRFHTRGECLRHRNQAALEAALLGPDEAGRARRLLEAMGYRVREEALDPARLRSRILLAHGAVGPTHQVRLLNAPGLGSLVLVREGPCQRAKPHRPRCLRVLPVGGNR